MVLVNPLGYINGARTKIRTWDFNRVEVALWPLSYARIVVVGLGGLEPPTSPLSAEYSKPTELQAITTSHRPWCASLERRRSEVCRWLVRIVERRSGGMNLFIQGV